MLNHPEYSFIIVAQTGHQGSKSRFPLGWSLAHAIGFMQTFMFHKAISFLFLVDHSTKW